MKILPILYSEPMVVAKLEHRKTNTRRTSKLDKINKAPDDWRLFGNENSAYRWDFKGNFIVAFKNIRTDVVLEVKSPYGGTGDILYVRETWDYAEDELGRHDKKTKGDCFGKFLYKANGDGNHGRWRPSIHMPKEAARIWDRVVDVRVERLQDISEEDAIAEGAQHFPHIPVGPITSSMSARPERWSMESSKDTDSCVSSARWAFAGYIDKISPAMNGNRIWAANPWVWVVKTETLSTTGKPQNLASPR